jgi:hypothetical protein
MQREREWERERNQLKLILLDVINDKLGSDREKIGSYTTEMMVQNYTIPILIWLPARDL